MLRRDRLYSFTLCVDRHRVRAEAFSVGAGDQCNLSYLLRLSSNLSICREDTGLLK